MSKEPIKHFQLKKEHGFYLNRLGDADNPVCSICHSIYAQCISTTDDIIVDAIVDTLREAGYDHAFLIDREFVLETFKEALKEAQGGTKPVVTTQFQLEGSVYCAKCGKYLCNEADVDADTPPHCPWCGKKVNWEDFVG